MARVSVYIDGANFLYGIKSINKYYTDFKFDFKMFIEHVTKKDSLIDVYYYNASLKQGLNPGLFSKQQKFFARLKKEGLNVVLCRRQRRTSIDGDEYFSIKGDDIHLAIDMLRDAYDNKFDKAILISGDGDFAPLVRYVRAKGKHVDNYHFVGNISLDLIKECNTNFPLDKKIVNKFFFREKTENLLEDTDSGRRIKDLLDKDK